jgi:hypothetical protein
MKPSRKKLGTRIAFFVVGVSLLFFCYRSTALDPDNFYFPGAFAILFAFLAMIWADIPLEDLRSRNPSDAWARFAKRVGVVALTAVAVFSGLISLAKLARLLPDVLHRN